jgi:hypothetical protein
MVTVTSAMMGLSVCTIGMLLRADAEASRTAAWLGAAARFNRQLRDDLRVAVSATDLAPGGEPRLDLSLEGGRQVRYQSNGHIVERTLMEQDRAIHQDWYRFRPGSTISILCDNSKRSVRVVVAASRTPLLRSAPPPDAPAAGVTYVIEAPLAAPTTLDEAAP